MTDVWISLATMWENRGLMSKYMPILLLCPLTWIHLKNRGLLFDLPSCKLTTLGNTHYSCFTLPWIGISTKNVSFKVLDHSEIRNNKFRVNEPY
jgi:hypothetical protein